ncbi:MAG TPA: cell wall hydrolase [Methanosarcinales archaeon]|nr:cell wall hydrolase [Methanosarcinales archaeon]
MALDITIPVRKRQEQEGPDIKIKEKPVDKIKIASETDMLARAIWAEARGEDEEGQKAVANVIMNRIKQKPTFYGDTVYKVVTKPYQFESYTNKDTRKKMMSNDIITTDEYKKAYSIASKAIKGELEDNTNGANLFYNPKNMQPKYSVMYEDIIYPLLGNQPNVMIQKLVTGVVKDLGQIGNHRFLKEK